MNTVEQYLKTGSFNNVPHGALQVLDVLLKNRPSSLRLIYIDSIQEEYYKSII